VQRRQAGTYAFYADHRTVLKSAMPWAVSRFCFCDCFERTTCLSCEMSSGQALHDNNRRGTGFAAARACVTVRMHLMILTCMLLYGQSQQHGSHRRDINCQDEVCCIVRDKSHFRIESRRRPRKSHRQLARWVGREIETLVEEFKLWRLLDREESVTRIGRFGEGLLSTSSTF